MLGTDLPLLVALLLLSAFFSGTEAAFFSLNRVQLRRLEQDGRRSSRQILQVLAQPGRFLTTVLIGNTLVNIALSVFTTSLFLRLLGEHGVEVAIAATTLAVLLVGEVTPKTLAVNFPEAISRWNVRVVQIIQLLLGPLAGAVTFLSDACLRVLGMEARFLPPSHRLSRGELGTLLEGADREGIMTAEESQLVNNILQFSSTRAEEVMTPRVDVTAAPLEMEREELEALVIESKRSRIPIYQNTIDEITGYLPTRDLLLHPETRPQELLRPIGIFPERAFISRVFYETQKNRTPMSIVVNEYGETVGLLTQEDLLEELVGEIYDEFETQDEPVRKMGEGVYLVSGQIGLEDLNEELGIELPLEDALTLNGFLSGLFGGIPPKGQEIRWDGLSFQVSEASRHRILKCVVRLHGTDPAQVGS